MTVDVWSSDFVRKSVNIKKNKKNKTEENLSKNYGLTKESRIVFADR